jgi:hypothetical protein
MRDYRASELSKLCLKAGEVIRLESLRQAVVPPYLLLMPFAEFPESLEVVRQDALEEDGVHGCVYTLKATTAGTGQVRLGFKDLRGGEIVIEKRIALQVNEAS